MEDRKQDEGPLKNKSFRKTNWMTPCGRVSYPKQK